jgi:hypothetical protein
LNVFLTIDYLRAERQEIAVETRPQPVQRPQAQRSAYGSVLIAGTERRRNAETPDKISVERGPQKGSHASFFCISFSHLICVAPYNKGN